MSSRASPTTRAARASAARRAADQHLRATHSGRSDGKYEEEEENKENEENENEEENEEEDGQAESSLNRQTAQPNAEQTPGLARTAGGSGTKKTRWRRGKKKRRRNRKKAPPDPDADEILEQLEIPRRARDFPFELDEFATSKRLNLIKFTTLVSLCERRNVGIRRIVRPPKKKKGKKKKKQQRRQEEASADKSSTPRTLTAAERREKLRNPLRWKLKQQKLAQAPPSPSSSSGEESEDSTENPRLDFDDKQVLVDRILEWRESRKKMREEARVFEERMRQRHKKFPGSEARDAARPKVYKRVCRKCGLVWQSEEVPDKFGSSELRWADRQCQQCRFPHKFKRTPPPLEEGRGGEGGAALQSRLKEIRGMSLQKLRSEMKRLGLANDDASSPSALSPTIYSAKFGAPMSRRSSKGVPSSGATPTPLALLRRPPPSKTALVARLERHARKQHGNVKPGVPALAAKRKPRKARTLDTNQGISLYAFTGNLMEADWRRLEERARQLLEGKAALERPKTVQEYQAEFLQQHIALERSKASPQGPTSTRAIRESREAARSAEQVEMQSDSARTVGTPSLAIGDDPIRSALLLHRS